MNLYVVTSTLRDMLRPVRILPWVLLAIVLSLVSLLFVKMSDRPLGAEEYGMIVRLIVYRVVALAAAMFTMMVVAQDIEQKTIVYTVTRTIPRNVMVASRTMAAALSVALMSWMSLVGVGVVFLGGGLFTSGMFWMDLVIMLLGACAYCSLFVFVTLIMNRAMLAILFFTFLWESFVPFLKGDMYLVTINTYMSVLATHPNKAAGLAVTAMQSDSSGVAAWIAWVVLLGVAVAMSSLNGWWFSRNQFLPREDAE